jgi:hypothetical protein
VMAASKGRRMEGRKAGREGGRKEGAVAPLLKSGDPHLAGGEQT